jgi:DNA-directed RNA polymerase specialized sigma subunit
MLDTPREVVRCLLTYTDWWQPSTASVLVVGKQRRDKSFTDGLHPGIVETLEERSELCRRMAKVGARERMILFLWYVKQLHVDDVADAVKISRRQCFRLRAQTVQRVVKMGEPAASQ